MKLIISESQLKKIILEQSKPTLTPSSPAQGLTPTTNVSSGTINPTNGQGKMDPHDLMMILAIGSAFIPVAGPFISAGIGLIDAGMYYKEGDKKAAGLTAAFSVLPFVGPIVSKIPGVKQLGVKGMALLSSKLSSGKLLTKAELEIANAIKKYTPEIQQELTNLTPKLKSVVKELDAYRGNFIKKYGQNEYDDLLVSYLYGGTDKKGLIGKLKSVKNPNIQVKPVLGGGADHRVFQSTVNPNVVFKVEVRAGEVNKWFNTFKKYPKIFANPLRKVKVKGSNGELLDAVEMEKLETATFTKLWLDIEKNLYNAQKALPLNQQVSSLEILLKNVNKGSSYRQIWTNLSRYAKKQMPTISNKIDELSSMVEELYKVTPNPDIRKYNLGYDSNGVLKVLDI